MLHRDNAARKIADKLSSDLARYSEVDGSLQSVRSLAAEFGVSHQTVSRAVRMLAKENLVTCKQGARAVCRKNSCRPRLACMICTDFSEVKLGMYSDLPFQVQILLDELNKRQCDYKIFNFYDLKQANFSPRLFSSFDGLITSRAFSDIHSRQLVNNFSGPKVWLWNNEPSTESGNQVVPDFMTGYTELFTRARKAGIRKCVLHCSRKFFAGVMTDALYLSDWSDDEFTLEMHEAPETQLKAYKYALNLPVSSDILHVCASDMFAYGFIEAFLDRNYRPGEFHVSGTGDIESHGFQIFDRPFLTTLHTNRYEVIHKGLDCLLSKIGADNSVPEEIIRIKTELVIRDSALKMI